jgi:hypothetical protein
VRSHLRRSFLASGLICLAAVICNPAIATAHVNRTVGPYTIFLVLIEEPTFETNRAGFEFWVHEGERSISGLDRTLKAEASNTGGRIALLISPLNDRGFYDVETDLQGRPFDPGAGGDWTLRLTGTVEGGPVDVSLPTTFPAYPRVSTPGRPAAPTTSSTGLDPWLTVDAALAIGFAGWLGLKVRRRRGGPKPT